MTPPPDRHTNPDPPDPSQLAPAPTSFAGYGGLRFIQAHPDHRDPPGTIRWCVQQPDGRIRPVGARPITEPDAAPHRTPTPVLNQPAEAA